MEKEKDNTLMKARSYRSILTTGFQLYTEHFRRLFKASWLMALLYAITGGFLGVLTAIKVPEILVGIVSKMTGEEIYLQELAQEYGSMVLMLFAMTLLSIITFTLASATIVNKLKVHKDTGHITMPTSWLKVVLQMTGRTAKGVGMTLLLLLIPLLLTMGLLAATEHASPHFILRHPTTVGATFCLLTLIVLLLALPLGYVLMKYLMEAPRSYLHTLGESYGCGMRHWGSLFLVLLVSILFVTLASIVTGLPASILYIANQTAQMGLLMGDPLGMPSHITTLTFLTFLLTCFFQFYVCQVTLIHSYYVYGSIEAKELEKQQIKQQA